MWSKAKFRLSTKGDCPYLKKIYELSFGEGPESADLLFQRLYRKDNCYVALQWGKPVAMSFAVPVEIIAAPGKSYHGVYVYAVATHPRRRGRSLATDLLEYIWQEAQTRGMSFALLVPAAPGLFRFYGKRGYVPVGGVCRGQYITVAQETSLQVEFLSGENYWRIREDILAPTPHLVWQEDILLYQQEMLKLFGGGFCQLKEGREVIGCGAVTFGNGKVLDVQELLLPPERLKEALAALWKLFLPEKIKLRLEERRGQELGLEKEPLAMIRTSPEVLAGLNGLYVALVMD